MSQSKKNRTLRGAETAVQSRVEAAAHPFKTAAGNHADAAGENEQTPLNILTVPGLGGSGPRHWQSLWEKENPGFRRVEQTDWERAVRQDWVDALECAVYDAGPDTILVAHSLGCLAVVHWAVSTQQKIKGALLVAVPDPDGALIADRVLGFSPLPAGPLPFPSVVAASTDDAFGSSDFANAWAVRWGSRFVSMGPVGHVNAESGLGSWSQGYELLESLTGPRLARTNVLAVS